MTTLHDPETAKRYWNMLPEVQEAQKILNNFHNALSTQEGGNHYKNLAIQPVEYIHANNIGYFEGCVIKYVTRWRAKNGLEDLKKARHFIDLLLELESKNANLNAQEGDHPSTP